MSSVSIKVFVNFFNYKNIYFYNILAMRLKFLNNFSKKTTVKVRKFTLYFNRLFIIQYTCKISTPFTVGDKINTLNL